MAVNQQNPDYNIIVISDPPHVLKKIRYGGLIGVPEKHYYNSTIINRCFDMTVKDKSHTITVVSSTANL